MTLVATQFEYIMYCTVCHDYLVPGDDHCKKEEKMVQHSDLKRCQPSSSKFIDFEGFGKALLKKHWEHDCGGIEGDEIQDIALEYGLIVRVAYDPEKHGDGGLEFGLEKGDEWYVSAWGEKEDGGEAKV